MAVTWDPLRSVSPLPSGTFCMTVAIIVAPLPLLSERKLEFKCAEPAVLGFIPRYFLMGYGNKMPVRLFTLVWMSETT
jgi:hypothetical protein